MKTFISFALWVVTCVGVSAAPPDDFTLKSVSETGSFSLQAAKGQFVALHFLLKTECPVCLRHTREHMTKAAALPNVIQVFVKPDTEEEIRAWADQLPPEELAKTPIYRDPDAALAKAFEIPDGYAFHGQVVHYPATVLIGPDGKEVFRYVGKNNRDRLSFDQLAAKVAELSKPGK